MDHLNTISRNSSSSPLVIAYLFEILAYYPIFTENSLFRESVTERQSFCAFICHKETPTF